VRCIITTNWSNNDSMEYLIKSKEISKNATLFTKDLTILLFMLNVISMHKSISTKRCRAKPTFDNEGARESVPKTQTEKEDLGRNKLS
jgi:hypothetical protein